MEKIVLDNGLRILLDPIDGARSASVGVWVAAGSRHEDAREQGISHFIEHMLFKGTARRSARDISEEMDRLGGNINAYTSKEYTRYYAQCLAENAAGALDILCDMLVSPRLDRDEMERERGVILDEMAMYEDSGEDVAHETLCAAVWPDSPLGRTICGRTETVSALSPDNLRRYMHRHYTPERMVAAVAGGFGRDETLRLLRDTLGTLPRGEGAPALDEPSFTPALALTAKEFEQTSLSLALPGLPSGDPRRYAMSLLNFIVGGGASSRLFQRLREELGLAYSVYSASYASKGAGLFTVAASFSAGQQEQVLSEIQGVLRALPGSITDEEFERARAQVKASFILGLETVASQASYIGRNELLEGRAIPPEEAIAALEKLTKEDIEALAADLLGDPRRALSVAGEIHAAAFYDPFWKG